MQCNVCDFETGGPPFNVESFVASKRDNEMDQHFPEPLELLLGSPHILERCDTHTTKQMRPRAWDRSHQVRVGSGGANTPRIDTPRLDERADATSRAWVCSGDGADAFLSHQTRRTRDSWNRAELCYLQVHLDKRFALAQLALCLKSPRRPAQLPQRSLGPSRDKHTAMLGKWRKAAVPMSACKRDQCELCSPSSSFPAFCWSSRTTS